MLGYSQQVGILVGFMCTSLLYLLMVYCRRCLGGVCTVRFKMNKFEHVRGGPNMNKFEHVRYVDPPLHTDVQTVNVWVVHPYYTY